MSEETKKDSITRLEELAAIDKAIAKRAAVRRHPTDTTQRLQAQLAVGQRDAFLEEVAAALDTRPSMRALKTLAEDDPLRHAQYLQVYAKLGGVSERVEVTNKAEAMSDAELFDWLQQHGFSVPDAEFPHLIEHGKDDQST